MAIQSHKFFNQKCIDMEGQINVKIDKIFHTDEAGKEPSKEDIESTVALVNRLLTLSSKYLAEGKCVLESLENLTDEDKSNMDVAFMKAMSSQIAALNEKQENIHNRVQEIQQMLIEMYNLNEDDTF